MNEDHPADHPRRRGLRQAGVAAALIGALLSAAPVGIAEAHTTQGRATPGNDGPHPWSTDGCSTPGININSVRGVFNFRHACEHHDGCYKGFPRDGKPTYWVSRSQCDSWFLYDMQASCRWQHGDEPSATKAGRDCEQWASNYLYAVRTHAARGYLGPDND